MNYPVKTTYLIGVEDLTDEEATILVIEALEDGGINKVEFSDQVNRNSLIEEVKDWSDYDKYRSLIVSQKKLFVKAPMKVEFDENIDSEGIKLSRAVSKKHKQKQSYRRLRHLGVAASILAIAYVGATIANNADTNSNGETKISSSASYPWPGDQISNSEKYSLSQNWASDSESGASAKKRDSGNENEYVYLGSFETLAQLRSKMSDRDFFPDQNQQPLTDKALEIIPTKKCAMAYDLVNTNKIYWTQLQNEDVVFISLDKDSQPKIHVNCEIVEN